MWQSPPCLGFFGTKALAACPIHHTRGGKLVLWLVPSCTPPPLFKLIIQVAQNRLYFAGSTVSLSVFDKVYCERLVLFFGFVDSNDVFSPMLRRGWTSTRLTLTLSRISGWLYKFQFIPRSWFLKQCFPNFNCACKSPGHLDKMQILIQEFWGGIMNLPQAPHRCQGCWSKDHVLNGEDLKRRCYYILCCNSCLTGCLFYLLVS